MNICGWSALLVILVILLGQEIILSHAESLVGRWVRIIESPCQDK